MRGNNTESGPREQRSEQDDAVYRLHAEKVGSWLGSHFLGAAGMLKSGDSLPRKSLPIGCGDTSLGPHLRWR